MAKAKASTMLSERRILIENSEYWLSNIGDLAMLDVTIRRLRARWPDARIGVLTDSPVLLHAYFPDAEPIHPTGTRCWTRPTLVGRMAKRAGPRVIGPVAIGWLSTKARVSQRLRWLRRNAHRVWEAARPPGTDDYVQTPARTGYLRTQGGRFVPCNTDAAVRSASLVLALGGGYITDIDKAQATRVLNLLGHAADLQIPTAMIGQGLGPLQDDGLLSQAAEVLPQLDYIGLRECLRGPELLALAGVPPTKVKVTGDDAIELSYEVRRDDIGSDIGINLRVASYSPVSTDNRSTVREVLRDQAAKLHAGLLPLIIAEYKSQDRRSTRPLIRGVDAARRPIGRFASPRDVALQVTQCRVVVTGAYHAAVFALAQGIPVVAMTSSQYYDEKFQGLAAMFEGGLQLVRLDSVELKDCLATAVARAWVQAPSVREPLLARALEQITASSLGLAALLDSVESSMPRRR